MRREEAGCGIWGFCGFAQKKPRCHGDGREGWQPRDNDGDSRLVQGMWHGQGQVSRAPSFALPSSGPDQGLCNPALT